MKSLFNYFIKSTLWRDLRIRLSLISALVISIIALIVNFAINAYLGFALFIILVVLFGIAFYTFSIFNADSNEYVADLTERIGDAEQEALIKMPIGILLYTDDHKIEWINPYLAHYLDQPDILGHPISEISSVIEDIVSEKKHAGALPYIKWGNHYFEVVNQKSLNAFYMLEVTRYAKIEINANDRQLAFGQIAVNNYDEISDSMDDLTLSNVNNLLTRELNNWANRYNIYMKKTSEDHYIFMCFARDINEAKKNNFKILDLIRIQSSQLNAPLTLSMGIYYGEDNINALAKQAQNNLDVAQNRGGDQVVFKASDSPTEYFGGKTDPLGKRTHVRARSISFAVQEQITRHQQVFVMGHARPDLDVLGASLGIRKIAAMNGVRCYIVVDSSKVHTDVKRLLNVADDYDEIKEDIIPPEKALKISSPDDLLILVDHSKPSMSVSPDLYQRLSQNVVIIDHHRQGEDFPADPLLIYIEPYASSTCELVTELFEYQPTNLATISKLDATAMLAGISVDTQSFKFHTGTRTFDAASYLRSNGADEKLIHNLLKEKVSNYLAMSKLISTMDLRDDGIAIAHGEDDLVYDPVIGAQAADTMISLDGISASFVIIKREDGTIGISARSMGDFNVQLVMEKMGGGGHLGNAATQIVDSTIAEAKEQLIEILDQAEDPKKK
ncbi:DHH family phosphoesterase [Xylocopilactobacillus apicola]|uniref:Cyclic-di-AMP phosphodiesterase n=1 Tax=Xylocopilactobacillus apicola TaxID=2932184 RepID=A0AAU9DRK3_9LACO|nr:DHH family phosphoesterase [Xylocopilactobacillus apicola]BDR57803.1 DHH family phosphoesterase [Xylocopilactobacillus apicola]